MYNEIDLDKIDISKEPPTDEPARQYYFMAKCREWVREFEKKNGRRPFFFTQTFGWPTATMEKSFSTWLWKSYRRSRRGYAVYPSRFTRRLPNGITPILSVWRET